MADSLMTDGAGRLRYDEARVPRQVISRDVSTTLSILTVGAEIQQGQGLDEGILDIC